MLKRLSEIRSNLVEDAGHLDGSLTTSPILNQPIIEARNRVVMAIGFLDTAIGAISATPRQVPTPQPAAVAAPHSDARRETSGAGTPLKVLKGEGGKKQ